MSAYLFRGGRLLDPHQGVLIDGIDVLVEDEIVKEVSDKPIVAKSAEVIACNGKVVMPGLIDNHIHIYYFLSNSGPFFMNTVPPTFSAAMATMTLRSMLMRGFTTVRDMGGADYGMRDAVNAGYVEAPRLFISGRAISQTGGHGDFRSRVEGGESSDVCCTGAQLMCVVADGVPDVIRTVRNELRRGADQIKLMLSGGVASPNDPLESVQFTTDEIAAAVDEAKRWGVYVGAHAYSNESIVRGVKHGVRTIEHGNFVEREGAELMREKDAFLVPTLITYEINKRLGAASGKSPSQLAKNDIVHAAGLASLDVCRSAGVEIGFGSDLMTYTQKYQTDGLAVQAQVQSNKEVIRSATLVNARILRQEGKLGEIVPGAHADILVVDGNPLEDLSVFQDRGTRLSAIMRGGHFYKNAL
ncbi:amidohydrolase family protein [Bosea sp. LjRoot9]|uniref:metal-dependent hydrolase family protein n=1 Tax=Bosea sp. LjRoot9 TaxID=3342341 RepID=UPI003ED06C61